MKARRGLGKGLDALIPQGNAPSSLKRVSLEAIEPNPHQPRTMFDQSALQELADSIRELGLIQPLIVQQLSQQDITQPARYRIITGERRWRAAKLAGLVEVDVIIKEASPQEMLELALVENIQRADLNPLEEAQAYRQLADEFGMTQERIAERVGRSRVSVTNSMRLLRLPEEIKEGLLAGKIQEGHAIVLLMLDTAEEQKLAYHALVKRQLSVRQTEELVRRLHATTQPRTQVNQRSPEIESLEQQLRDALGTKVELYHSRKGGKVVIYYYSDEELDTIYDRLTVDISS
jgi:ParB family transcriptional regulator, chromosome partitioning protein